MFHSSVIFTAPVFLKLIKIFDCDLSYFAGVVTAVIGKTVVWESVWNDI